MRDGVLAALFHAARATGARATGVFVPGHRVACLGSLGDGTPSATEAEATRTTHALGEAVARKLNELDRSDRSADVFENAYRYDAAAAERFRAARLWRENAGAPARGRDVLVMRGDARDRKAKTEKQIQPIL